MKWTDIQTGKARSAFQHFMVALGNQAEVVMDRINAEPMFVQRLAAYVLNGSVEPTVSQKRGHEIMGRNMFSVEEAIKHFGVDPTRLQLVALSEIPFSGMALERAKDTHILVAVFPLSILDIHGNVQDKGLFGNQDYYKKEFFAKKRGEATWQLVRKTPVDNSTSKNWQEQRALLGKKDEVPSAQVMVYTIIGHFLATGERLFENVYVRTSSVFSSGPYVRVGRFDAKGLFVDRCRDDSGRALLEVSAAQKRALLEVSAAQKCSRTSRS